MRPEDEKITFSTIDFPQWLDSSRQAIICNVQFGHLPDPEIFIARADDPMPYGVTIYRQCLSGTFGTLTVADAARSSHLPRTNDGSVFLVGDVIVESTDAFIQAYVKSHNRENRSGSETGTVLTWGSILDDCLRRLLDKNNIPNFRYRFAMRIDKCRAERLISQSLADRMHTIREIRNGFGHEHDADLSSEPQKSLCDSLAGEQTASLRLRFSSVCIDVMLELHAEIIK